MDLVEALESAPDEPRSCLVCELTYRADVDKALRIAKTGRWTVVQVFKQMQRMHGFKGSYDRVRRHAREHMGSEA